MSKYVILLEEQAAYAVIELDQVNINNILFYFFLFLNPLYFSIQSLLYFVHFPFSFHPH